MSDQYATSKPGRLTFKGGAVATLSKSISKSKKHKSKNKKPKEEQPSDNVPPLQEGEEEIKVENIYTIDAAKKMKYEELFPVEAKKFSYSDQKGKGTGFGSVEERLDDRVKKKADRYCK